MPKYTHIPVKLPDVQPDNCASCPLCGLIPLKERSKFSREGYVCLGTQEAISSKGVKVRASSRDKAHPLHRPCDPHWNVWQQLPRHEFMLNANWYSVYRIPYEQNQQMCIKFHTKKKEKNQKD